MDMHWRPQPQVAECTSIDSDLHLVLCAVLLYVRYTPQDLWLYYCASDLHACVFGLASYSNAFLAQT